jgi:hypothetical protein
MILCDNCKVEIKGHVVIVCSELACLLKAMREKVGISEDMIEKAIEISKAPDETLDRKAKEVTEKLGMEQTEMLLKALRK